MLRVTVLDRLLPGRVGGQLPPGEAKHQRMLFVAAFGTHPQECRLHEARQLGKRQSADLASSGEREPACEDGQSGQCPSVLSIEARP